MADSSGEELAYERLVLKLSGEVLQGQKDYGLAPDFLDSIAAAIAAADQRGVQVTVVVGGGNIFRGLEASKQGMDRVTGDYIGMLATVMNGLALKNSLETHGSSAKIFSALDIEVVTEPFDRDAAVDHLDSGGVNIAVAGTGHPFFTTDTAAVLRALELEAEVFLKATRVDGVYEKDPEVHPDARRYDQLTFMEALSRNLQIMDLSATSLCRENDLPVIVFDINDEDNIERILDGEKVGTIIKGDD